jgi:hypothetical protein
MAQVQARAGLSKQVLPMAGQAVGGAYGGPAGAMVGGMVGTKLAGGDATPVGGSGAADAISRRLQQPAQPPQDPSQDLEKADQALAYLPPEQQQKYGPIIRRARYLDGQTAVEGVA